VVLDPARGVVTEVLEGWVDSCLHLAEAASEFLGAEGRPGVAMDAKYYTLSISIHRIAETYQVELSHSDPDSQARWRPCAARRRSIPRAAAARAVARRVRRRAHAAGVRRHGVARRFIQVEAAAQASDNFLRVLAVHRPSAQELQALRWELLRHPRSDAALSDLGDVLLSRFMVSRDWRPVKLRARTELTR
jgi:hypothetical protein